MISKWQAAYEMIRFTNYTFFNYDNDTGVIWLKDDQASNILTVSDRYLSEEELRNVSESIASSKEHLSNLVKFKVTNVKNLYLVEDKFNLKHKYDGVKVSHKSIEDVSSLLANPFYKLEINNKKSKKDKHYIKRLMSAHPLEIFMMKFTPMTLFLITFNLVIFLMALFKVYISNDMMFVNRLAVSHAEVVNGEYYRLLTSAFLHVGVEHFLLNMVALYVLGKVVETIYGSYLMFIAYISTGILSSLFSLMFLTDTISLGASGAIFGLLGIAIMHLIIYKKVNAKLLIQIGCVFIIISLLTSIFSNVNHFAHIGGLIFGILFGVIFNPKKFKKLWYISAFGLFIVLAIISYIIMYDENAVFAYDKKALESLETGDYNQALSYVNFTLQEDQASALTYHVLAQLYEQSGDDEMSEEYHDKSLQMDHTNEQAVKRQLLELRKVRDYEEMESIIDDLNIHTIEDEELQLLIEEYETYVQ